MASPRAGLTERPHSVRGEGAHRRAGVGRRVAECWRALNGAGRPASYRHVYVTGSLHGPQSEPKVPLSQPLSQKVISLCCVE